MVEDECDDYSVTVATSESDTDAEAEAEEEEEGHERAVPAQRRNQGWQATAVGGREAGAALNKQSGGPNGISSKSYGHSEAAIREGAGPHAAGRLLSCSLGDRSTPTSIGSVLAFQRATRGARLHSP
jgi:hypothetical protein